MSKKPKVYLAGQPDEYERDWKKKFKTISYFDFYDWEVDSDQSSSDTFFPQDLQGVKSADYMVVNPGVNPSEGCWIETGYFYASNVSKPGDFCNNLIIIWNKKRSNWSIEFVKKCGHVVSSVEEAMNLLKSIN